MATAGWPNWPKGTDWREKHLREYLDTVPEWAGADLTRPIAPRRVTEYGRLMWADDLGLPSNNTPPYFWLGREAEA